VLIKRFTEAQKMMKKMQKLGPKGMQKMMRGGGGGMPPFM
jgi:signal recognition particle subunit SRP54